MCNCRIGYYCGNIAYIFERLASCCALASVVTCIMTTLLFMLAIGIGLGYTYCYIDMETGRNKDDELLLPDKPVETHVTTSAKGLILQRGGMLYPTTETPFPVDDLRPTMVVPLKIGVNFTYLIARIREQNQNVTLELVT